MNCNQPNNFLQQDTDVLKYLLIGKMFTLIGISADNLDVSNLSNNSEELSALGTFSGRIKYLTVQRSVQLTSKFVFSWVNFFIFNPFVFSVLCICNNDAVLSNRD